MPKKRPSCARLTTVIRARIYPVKDVVDRHSTGTRIHGERRDGYVRYHARARSAILLADWPRRNEQRSEAVKRRGERRGRYPSEGESTALGVRGGATMEGTRDACACFPASLSNYHAFCPLCSQVIKKKTYIPAWPACLACSACLPTSPGEVDLPCS